MFSIKDLDMDLKDLKEALKVLKQLLNLEIVEQHNYYEKYIRKNLDSQGL